MRLKMSLYGLKPARRLWVQLSHGKPEHAGLQAVLATCFCTTIDSGNEITVVKVYVVDLLVKISL